MLDTLPLAASLSSLASGSIVLCHLSYLILSPGSRTGFHSALAQPMVSRTISLVSID